MFNSVEATDEREFYISKNINLSNWEDEELKKYFVPSNLCLITSDGHKYGPFGTDSLGTKPVTIQIGNGDVLAQATSSFIYDFSRKTFKNNKCFSFYVSNEMKISEVADGSRIETIERFSRVWLKVDLSRDKTLTNREVTKWDWFKIKTSKIGLFFERHENLSGCTNVIKQQKITLYKISIFLARQWSVTNEKP